MLLAPTLLGSDRPARPFDLRSILNPTHRALVPNAALTGLVLFLYDHDNDPWYRKNRKVYDSVQWLIRTNVLVLGVGSADIKTRRTRSVPQRVRQGIVHVSDRAVDDIVVTRDLLRNVLRSHGV